MLKSLTCDQSTFKPVFFRDGLNLVVADKTAGSAQKATRNGSGKSTLLEIVHHCLGAGRPSGSATLAHKAVQGWKFTLEFVAAGRALSVTRAVGSNDVLVTGDTAGLLFNEDGVLTRDQWVKTLAEAMFGITAEDQDKKKAPSFRQLIRYFARPDEDAMATAFETLRKQNAQEARLLTAFLLRLNWEIALRMKAASEQQSQLLDARRAVEAGAFDAEEASSAKLQAEETELESEIEQATAELKTFRVHRQYREIESEASRLTAEIQNLSQQNFGDRQLLNHYQEQIASEDVPDSALLLQLYRDAGVELGDKVAATLDEATRFHRSIVEDRRSFLVGEQRRVATEIATREESIHNLSDKRASLLTILQTHGALSEYEKLVSRVEGLKERLAQVARRRMLQLDLDQKKLRLNVQVAELRLQTQQEVLEQSKYIGGLQRIFGSFSKQLYGRWQHSLEVNAGKSGFDFAIDAVDRATSTGMRHAGIFCYDATLATIWSREPQQPGFLIHDSALFDPMEERQIEGAFNAMAADDVPFQYVCTLNTDRLPTSYPVDHESVVLRLTDRGTAGGLLGIRF